MSLFSRHSRKAPVIICAVCTLLVAAQYAAEWLIDYVDVPAIRPLIKQLRTFKPLQSAEFYTQDAIARYFGWRSKLRPELVYLAIDRDSIQLDQFDPVEIEASPALSLMKQGWPWPRRVYPLILDKLFDSGAKVVVMDLMFPTPREGDEAFHAALDKYRDRIVIGSNFVQGTRGDKDTNTLQLPSDDLILGTSPLDDRVGFVNFWPDQDEVIRRSYYTRSMSDIFGDPPETGEEVYRSLAAMALRKSGNGAAIPPPVAHRIRFAGPPGTFIPKSLCDLFDEKKWNSPEYDGGKFFRDKIVLIGPEGNFMKDMVRTPFGSMPGPEMHLNAINAALNGDFVTETSQTTRYLLIVLAGVIAWLICVEFPAPLLRLALLGLVCALWLGVAQILYNPAAFYTFTFNPLVTLCASTVCSLAWDFFMEQREKARIRNKFERYVSKQVVREMIDNPASLFHTMGGVRKPIAVLFTDLRGFTSMTEQAEDSQALVAQLNEYFDVMVASIFANDGCLDKFIGDAIMAVWGNIQSRGPAQDVRSAVIASLKMREGLIGLNKRWKEEGKPKLTMGMGVNYGEAIVGDLGSKQHQMNFTAIGDIVNLGSRIEGVTKEYGVDLLVGEDAASRVRDLFYMQGAGLVKVSGRKRPVELFYVIGERSGTPNPQVEEYLRVYDEGLALYKQGNFAAAGVKFQQAVGLRDGDKLSRMYVGRCAVLEKEPPAGVWDGVFVMTKK